MQTKFSMYSVTQSTRVYRNGPKERKCPVSGTSLDKKKAWLLSEVRGEWPDCFKLIVSQLPNGWTQKC